MKNLINLLTAVVSVALLATGCVNEDPACKKNGTEDSSNSKGYLSLSGLNMRVVLDTQTDTRNETTTSSVTRATANVDDFIVEITNSDNVSVLKKTYAELKASVADSMALAVGSYHVSVISENTASVPNVGWDHPYYGASQDFTITKNKKTTLNEIVCTLQNIKVSFECAADLAALLTTDSKATVTIGSNSADFGLTETRASYFMPASALNTLIFNFKGKYADDNSSAQITKKIDNVKAGQWRKIKLAATYLSGKISFNITVENLIQDETVTVNSTESLWEEAMTEGPDPSAPTISWPNHDLSQIFQLKASMFTTDSNDNTICTEPFKFTLTSPNGITSFKVNISSTSTDFMNSINTTIGGSSFDLCQVTTSHPAYNTLKLLGFPLGAKLTGATTKTFDIGNAMPMLYEFSGTHTFAFELTDANGLKTAASLVILVDKTNEGGGTGAAPTIVWDNHDLTQRYTVASGDSLIIKLAAEAGFKSVQVEINMQALTDDDLMGLGIPPSFDLCNVQGFTYNGNVTSAETAAATIKQLGFPVNSEIKGKTSQSFDLSGFISLMESSAAGDNDFKLTIVDNNGQTVSATLQLHVNKK